MAGLAVRSIGSFRRPLLEPVAALDRVRGLGFHRGK
jgi:hypothetical protein